MTWFIDFINGFISSINGLFIFMSTPIDALGGVTPLALLGSGLVAFLLLSITLRIVRG